jgi:hypothetical protein
VNTWGMLKLAGELLRLQALLDAQSIPMIAYKGPALAASLYGSMALRQAGDLDIVVRRTDVPRARQLLLDSGYEARNPVGPDAQAFRLRSRYGEEFVGQDGTIVELHWAFTNGDVALLLGFEELAPWLRNATVGAGAVPVPGAEDQLLVLAVHGAKHRWDRLELVCSFAESVRQDGPGIDWEHLEDRATALGVRRMLLLGLLLAHDLLGATPPARLISRARADRTVSDLALQIPRILAEDAHTVDTNSLTTDVFRFKLRERRIDRWRFLWYRLTTPSRPDSWSTITLGKVLVPVHAFKRPFMVVSKLLPMARQYLAGRRAGRQEDAGCARQAADASMTESRRARPPRATEPTSNT